MAAPVTGRKSGIGASAVNLSTSVIATDKGVVVKAAAANTGKVYVGFSNAVTANAVDGTDGLELSAGESVFIERSDVAAAGTNSSGQADAGKLWLIASTTGQAVFFYAS